MTVWQDFVKFAGLQITTGDVDPVYPVLKRLVDGLPEEDALRYVFLYVGHYDLPSAVERYAGGDPRWCGTERRGHRDYRKLIAHLLAVDAIRLGQGLGPWLRSRFEGDPRKDWINVQTTLRELWGNGAWAAYKTAEILQKTLGWPLEPSTLGLDGAGGPREGVCRLFPSRVSMSSSWSDIEVAGFVAANKLGYELGATVDLAQIETCFCDFASLCKGSYYVGHDLDQMAERIERATGGELRQSGARALWSARRRSFSPLVLVETRELRPTLAGRHDRRTLYRDTGAIVAPWDPIKSDQAQGVLL